MSYHWFALEKWIVWEGFKPVAAHSSNKKMTGDLCSNIYMLGNYYSSKYKYCTSSDDQIINNIVKNNNKKIDCSGYSLSFNEPLINEKIVYLILY